MSQEFQSWEAEWLKAGGDVVEWGRYSNDTGKYNVLYLRQSWNGAYFQGSNVKEAMYNQTSWKLWIVVIQWFFQLTFLEA